MRPELEAALRQWPVHGHLTISLLESGVDASELLAALKLGADDQEGAKLYQAQRAIVRKAHPLTWKEADDLEIAIFFDIWPDQCASWVGAIEQVNEQMEFNRLRRLRWCHVRARCEGPDAAPLVQLWNERMDDIRDKIKGGLVATLVDRPLLWLSQSQKQPGLDLPLPSVIKAPESPEASKLPQAPMQLLAEVFKGVRRE